MGSRLMSAEDNGTKCTPAFRSRSPESKHPKRRIMLTIPVASPQYLAIRSMPTLPIGWATVCNEGPVRPCKERPSRRNSPNEKGKEEKEALTVRETIPRTARKFLGPLEKSTSRGAFSFLPRLSQPRKRHFLKIGVVPEARSC